MLQPHGKTISQTDQSIEDLLRVPQYLQRLSEEDEAQTFRRFQQPPGSDASLWRPWKWRDLPFKGSERGHGGKKCKFRAGWRCGEAGGATRGCLLTLKRDQTGSLRRPEETHSLMLQLTERKHTADCDFNISGPQKCSNSGFFWIILVSFYSFLSVRQHSQARFIITVHNQQHSGVDPVTQSLIVNHDRPKIHTRPHNSLMDPHTHAHTLITPTQCLIALQCVAWWEIVNCTLPSSVWEVETHSWEEESYFVMTSICTAIYQELIELHKVFSPQTQTLAFREVWVWACSTGRCWLQAWTVTQVVWGPMLQEPDNKDHLFHTQDDTNRFDVLRGFSRLNMSQSGGNVQERFIIIIIMLLVICHGCCPSICQSLSLLLIGYVV